MTNPTPKKISELTTLATIATGDFIPVVDISDTSLNATGETKKVSYSTIKADIQSTINTAFVEEDPIFEAHPASDITLNQVGQWNAAYVWGNHAVQGYLQSISAQSIDALNDVDTSSATTNDILKWNGSSWVAAAEAGGTTINGLNDVGDVNISGVLNTQVLRYNSSSSKWENQTLPTGLSLSSFSVTQASASSSPSLSYNNANGVFTYTPPDLSSFSSDVVDDTSPQLGGNLDLNNKTIQGTGTINFTGEIRSDSLRLTNNATAPAQSTQREIKIIGQAPYFYDGTDWRPFFLINAPTQIPADTDWDSVMFRATFDSSFDDVKHNAVPVRSSTTNTALVGSPVKVGAKSLRLDQANIQWDVTDTAKYDFTGAWTMEAWVYIDDIGGFNNPDVIFSGTSATNTRNWALKIRKPSGTTDIVFSWFNKNNNAFSVGQGGMDIVTLAASNYIGAWNHIAYVKDATTGEQKLYLNGLWSGSAFTDNDILNPEEFALGYNEYYAENFDGMIDDLRVSESTRYTGNFTPPATQLPISGSTTQILPPQTDKKGEITLGATPAWKGSPGLTVAQQSSGTYRLTFASAYSNSDDYFITAQGMDHSSSASSYIRIARATTHVDTIVKNQANDNAVNTGAVGVQIINHI